MLEAAPQDTGKLLFYEKEQTHTLRTFARGHPSYASLWAVVGPEGGFSGEEIEQARAAGFHIVGLATPILRAETAGIVAAALCQFLWGEERTPLPEQGSMP
jgi:16S rRNA (uracil1498-N3)-methyltransferase